MNATTKENLAEHKRTSETQREPQKSQENLGHRKRTPETESEPRRPSFPAVLFRSPRFSFVLPGSLWPSEVLFRFPRFSLVFPGSLLVSGVLSSSPSPANLAEHKRTPETEREPRGTSLRKRTSENAKTTENLAGPSFVLRDCVRGSLSFLPGPSPLCSFLAFACGVFGALGVPW